jgi:hypothetical protein
MRLRSTAFRETRVDTAMPIRAPLVRFAAVTKKYESREPSPPLRVAAKSAGRLRRIERGSPKGVRAKGLDAEACAPFRATGPYNGAASHGTHPGTKTVSPLSL